MEKVSHPMISADFHGFPHCVCQTHGVNIVKNELQTVVGRSDYKYVSRLVDKMTSLSVS